MQETRQHILEILRESGQATVDEIVAALRRRRGEITPVTVRHHLAILQEENLIVTPKTRHRDTPGRPQHVYALTNQARDHFPNNYQQLAMNLLNQIQSNFPTNDVNVIFEGVADNMAREARIPQGPIEHRIQEVVEYLSSNGYEATWQRTNDGILLNTHNCPYHEVAHKSDSLCNMDMRLISQMLGVIPRLVSRVSDGSATCTYLIPNAD